MESKHANILVRTSCVLWLAILAGCAGVPPLSAVDLPALQDFDLPLGATATRISGGNSIIYAVPDDDGVNLSIFLADANQPRDAYQLIATVPASELGLAEGQLLAAPRTISFADDFDRAVVGLDNESFLLERVGTVDSPPTDRFRVRPDA
jgi:hypothetical protein